ncbi:hypothetical protein ACLOJK_015965 [Asimina triloba]
MLALEKVVKVRLSSLKRYEIWLRILGLESRSCGLVFVSDYLLLWNRKLGLLVVEGGREGDGPFASANSWTADKKASWFEEEAGRQRILQGQLSDMKVGRICGHSEV